MKDRPTAEELIAAYAVIERANAACDDAVKKAGLSRGHCFVMSVAGDAPEVSVNAGRKVFLHHNGRRLYESVTVLYGAPFDKLIAETAEFLKTKTTA